MIKEISYCEQIAQVAKRYIGCRAKKYRGPERGLTLDDGFDCSGFARYVLSEAGLAIPDYLLHDGTRAPIRHANEFFDHYGVFVQYGCQKAGDLVFRSLRGKWPEHMGIMVDETSYVHAFISRGRVMQTELSLEVIAHDDSRQIYTHNPIGFKRPTVFIPNNVRWSQRMI